MRNWSVEEEIVVVEHYKKHIENYRSKKPNWDVINEIMGNEKIAHTYEQVKNRVKNFIALDEEARQLGYYTATLQTETLFNVFILEENK